MCLAHDETLWHTSHSHRLRIYPRFGGGDSVWTQDDRDPSDGGDVPHEVHQFYAFWSTFKTLKTFEWVTPYSCGAHASPREVRFCKKLNKPYQEEMRAAYNEMIQVLPLLLHLHHHITNSYTQVVAKAMKSEDPRYLRHLAIRQQRQAADTQMTARDAQRVHRNQKKQKMKNKKKNKTTW
ncbi:hypothetical protein DFH07DRAFT_448476 [Mycena maculata]|uniref:Zuotin-like zuotin homology domain-containing protein n=1 Tax=Mycena maculata TaxID=230809 RepID=A0AAD7J954_9AGAR|nr:hypothetical protein DFH07DRAFT_448476 [Mycena maculata]